MSNAGRRLWTVECRPRHAHLQVSQKTIKENSQAVPFTGMGLMQRQAWQGRTKSVSASRSAFHVCILQNPEVTWKWD